MKLPAGREGGVIINPQKEGMLEHLMTFTGAIEIDTGGGRGFLLTRNGELLAAYFRDNQSVYRGASAIGNLVSAPGKSGQQQSFIMRTYDEEDFAAALALCSGNQLLVERTAPAAEPVLEPAEEMPADKPHGRTSIDKATLSRITEQPGVIAVSAFYEGFPVQSLGTADFEHVAARAEDLLRAGTAISRDMNLGTTSQLILETDENKFIIAPCGDLFLCIIARADAPLGLIRVIIKSIQTGVEDEI